MSEVKVMKLIAHRGASFEAPENTLAAFELAVQRGFDFIECDIQFSKDHEPYIFHDDTVERTSDGRGAFKQLRASEINDLDVGSWKNSVFKDERVPSLGRVLKFLQDHPHCQMNLELKKDQRYFSQNYLEVIAQMIHDQGLVSRVVFSSFDFALINDFAQSFSEFRYAGLLEDNETLALYETSGVKLEALHMSVKYFLNVFSQTKKVQDFPEIRIYTVNDQKKLLQCEALGAKRFFTDKLTLP